MSKQLFNDLMSGLIHDKKYNAKLPSENKLTEEYQMTRVDVRHVLSQLEDMGYVHSKQGIGRFYREKLPVIELNLTGSISFTEKMKEQNIPFETKHLSFNEVNENIDDLKILGNGPYYRVKRIRYVHHIPVAIHTSVVSSEMFPDIIQEGAHITSMFNFFNERGFNHLSATDTAYSVGFPLIDEQVLLDCKPLVPIFIIESSTIDVDSDKVLEFFKTIYRTDLFKYKVT